MIITLKLRKPEGMRKRDVHEFIANHIHKQFNTRQLKGEIGQKHPIDKEQIILWIETFCDKKKYLSIADKTRKDYWLFLERLYKTIMSNYIRKDELTKDTDEKLFSNAYYYPGLVYISGKGYMITNSNELIEKYREQREESLTGQTLHLSQKCQDAGEFVKQLPEHQRDLISTGQEVA